MKITHILFSGLGGHSSVVFSCIKADLEHEFKHSLIFYGIESILQSHIDNSEELKIPYLNIKKRKGLDLVSWWRVFQELRRKKPEVILLHSISLIIPTWIYAKVYRKKIIGIEHTSIVVKRRVENISSYIAGILSDKVVLLSRESKRDYLKNYKLNIGHKLRIIPNGIETAIFNKIHQNQERDYIHLTMISRFSIQKDHKTLIMAMKQVDGAKLTIAGNGATWNEINEFIRKNELEDKVDLCGLLNEKQIIELFRNTDIYVHASFGETLPTSILQAMSCELPVIGSNIAGINNLIEHKKSGLLYENKNVSQLAQKINYLIEHKEIRDSMGQNARKKIEKNYSNLRMFDQYKRLIASTLKKSSKRKKKR